MDYGLLERRDNNRSRGSESITVEVDSSGACLNGCLAFRVGVAGYPKNESENGCWESVILFRSKMW